MSSKVLFSIYTRCLNPKEIKNLAEWGYVHESIQSGRHPCRPSINPTRPSRLSHLVVPSFVPQLAKHVSNIGHPVRYVVWHLTCYPVGRHPLLVVLHPQVLGSDSDRSLHDPWPLTFVFLPLPRADEHAWLWHCAADISLVLIRVGLGVGLSMGADISLHLSLNYNYTKILLAYLN